MENNEYGVTGFSITFGFNCQQCGREYDMPSPPGGGVPRTTYCHLCMWGFQNGAFLPLAWKFGHGVKLLPKRADGV